MAFYLYEGSFLLDGGSFAISEDCCCAGFSGILAVPCVSGSNQVLSGTVGVPDQVVRLDDQCYILSGYTNDAVTYTATSGLFNDCSPCLSADCCGTLPSDNSDFDSCSAELPCVLTVTIGSNTDCTEADGVWYPAYAWNYATNMCDATQTNWSVRMNPSDGNTFVAVFWNSPTGSWRCNYRTTAGKFASFVGSSDVCNPYGTYTRNPVVPGTCGGTPTVVVS